MQYYSRPFTDRFPFQYTVESPAYVLHTCNLADYTRLLEQIKTKDIVEFTPQQVLKLQCSSFTVIKKQ